jgi:uncharacterized membrane protein YjdF
MNTLKIKLLFSTIIISFFFALGSKIELFEKINWYDKFMHLIAGIWVGIIIIWLLKKFSINIKKQTLLILGLGIVVGILWEFFELGLVQYLLQTYEYRSGLQPSWNDTFSDLLMDTIGILIAIKITKKPKPLV